jgi:hypothetical protein
VWQSVQEAGKIREVVTVRKYLKLLIAYGVPLAGLSTCSIIKIS